MSVKTENSNKTKSRSVRHKKSRGVLSVLRVLIVLLLIVAAALVAVLYLAKAGVIFRPVESSAAETPSATQPPVQTVVYTLRCVTPLEKALSVSAPEGETVTLPDAPEIDGLRFIGWADGKGSFVEQSEFVLDADLRFSAVYAPSFLDARADTVHAAFLSVGEDGYFRPEETLSRAQAAAIFRSLLEPGAGASLRYAEIPAENRYEKADAVLAELGAIGGEDPARLGELLTWLSAFYPETEAAYTFDSVAATDPAYGAFCLAMEQGWIEDASVSEAQILTRRDAARLFTRVCGRTGDIGEDYAKVGTILDVSFDDPDFWAIAEAVIPHEAACGEDGEHWSASEALPLREKGFFFIGTALHCVDERGSAVVNGSYGHFDFDAQGVITTGMPELDALVQDKLSDLGLDPATMTQEHMLRSIYDDVTYHNSYLGARKDELHEVGDISWVNDAAYRMLTVKKGCCYNYAAEFYVLAKAIGYDAVIYSGKINPEPIQRAHGWVEIEFDNIPYIFDTELEYTQVLTGNTGTVYYEISYERVKGWYYYRGE